MQAHERIHGDVHIRNVQADGRRWDDDVGPFELEFREMLLQETDPLAQQLAAGERLVKPDRKPRLERGGSDHQGEHEFFRDPLGDVDAFWKLSAALHSDGQAVAVRFDDGQAGSKLRQQILDGPDIVDLELGGAGEFGPGYLAERQAQQEIEMELALPGVDDLVVHGPGSHRLRLALPVLEGQAEPAQIEGVDQLQGDVVPLEGRDGQGRGVGGPQEEHHAAQDLVLGGVEVDVHRLAPGEKAQGFFVGRVAFHPGVRKVVGKVKDFFEDLGLQVVRFGRVPPNLPQHLFLVGVRDAQIFGTPGRRRPGQQVGAGHEERHELFVELGQLLRQRERIIFFGHADSFRLGGLVFMGA